MTLIQVHKEFVERLTMLYSSREALNISELVFEHYTGIARLKRITEKQLEISPLTNKKIQGALDALLQHQPVQYVLGEAWFCGKKFIVNEAVLIPRPETEELVELVINDPVSDLQNLKILDIGTGSGCIAIAIKLKLTNSEITAIDISNDALSVAKINCVNNNTVILWKQADILNEKAWSSFAIYDIIVSNPPYIPKEDKSTMADNVLKYEPLIALFTPGDKPLIFYEAIALFGLMHLKKEGKIFVEIHEAYAEEVQAIFIKKGYQVSLHKDMMGKERMVTAWR